MTKEVNKDTSSVLNTAVNSRLTHICSLLWLVSRAVEPLLDPAWGREHTCGMQKEESKDMLIRLPILPSLVAL